MKKSNLHAGVVFALLGTACLLAGLFTDTELDSLLFGLSGTGIITGLAMIFKYFYWTNDARKEQYNERLEQETIELHDERKTVLRDKSGRYAYLLGLVVISLSILLFSVIGCIGLVSNFKMITLYLFGYLLFQHIAGVVIFKILNEKF